MARPTPEFLDKDWGEGAQAAGPGLQEGNGVAMRGPLSVRPTPGLGCWVLAMAGRMLAPPEFTVVACRSQNLAQI